MNLVTSSVVSIDNNGNASDSRSSRSLVVRWINVGTTDRHSGHVP